MAKHLPNMEVLGLRPIGPASGAPGGRTTWRKAAFIRVGVAMAPSVCSAVCPVGAVAQATQPTATDRSGSGTVASMAQDPKAPAVHEVVVTARGPTIIDRIDRHVYKIDTDPAAKSGLIGDVLMKLPGVQVTSLTGVSFRGDPHVTIMIDGKVPLNGKQVILNLPASQIDRIEVISNPSAEFSPDGTAVINIITKKDAPLGFSGSFAARDSNRSDPGVTVQAALAQGPWTLKTTINAARTLMAQQSYANYSLPTVGDQADRRRGALTGTRIDQSIAYKFSDQATATLQGYINRSRKAESDSLSFVSDEDGYTGRSADTTKYRSSMVEATLTDHLVPSGLNIKGDYTHSYDNSAEYSQTEDDFSAGGVSAFSQFREVRSYEDDGSLKFDQSRVNGDNWSAGLEIDRTDAATSDLYDDTGSIEGPYADELTHVFTASQTISDLYFTYQHRFDQWVIMPGLRLEDARLSLKSDATSVLRDTVTLYPTFHLSRDVGQHEKFRLSYSRRVIRPELSDYDPGQYLVTGTTEKIGNPYLKFSYVDSLEAEYNHAVRDSTFELTAFDRVTHDLRSPSYSIVQDDVIVEKPINSGSGRSSGLSLTAAAPLYKYLDYRANLTLMDNAIPRFGGGKLEYGSFIGSSLLDFHTPGLANRKGDQFQINTILTGPTYTFEAYTRTLYHINLTWLHPLIKNWSLSLLMSDITRSFSYDTDVRVLDTAYRFRHFDPFSRAIRLSTVYQFGAS